MILKLLLDFIFNTLDFIINLIPQVSLPADFTGGITSFFDTLDSINAFIPLTPIYVSILTVLIIYNLQFIIGIVNWLIRKIPFFK